jgi:hypothetical protein
LPRLGVGVAEPLEVHLAGTGTFADVAARNKERDEGTDAAAHELSLRECATISAGPRPRKRPHLRMVRFARDRWPAAEPTRALVSGA